MSLRASSAIVPLALLLLVGAGQISVATPTRAQDGCDPNYEGACVPIASDVDCAGGSGNGPKYVQGPVTVVGTDIYGLDRDGDGIGCE
jgi:resuscitation-promoting factor RpfB